MEYIIIGFIAAAVLALGVVMILKFLKNRKNAPPLIEINDKAECEISAGSETNALIIQP